MSFSKSKKQYSISCFDSADHFLDPRKEDRKIKGLLSLSNSSGRMMLNREIILATQRLLRAAPYCPWRQETGNPTADIQSVRKSSWLCLKISIDSESGHLKPPPLYPGSNDYCLLSDDFISFQTGLFAPLHFLFPVLWPPDVKS